MEGMRVLLGGRRLGKKIRIDDGELIQGCYLGRVERMSDRQDHGHDEGTDGGPDYVSVDRYDLGSTVGLEGPRPT